MSRTDELQRRLAEVEANPNHPYRESHLRVLRRMLGRAPYDAETIDRLVAAVQGEDCEGCGEFVPDGDSVGPLGSHFCTDCYSDRFDELPK